MKKEERVLEEETVEEETVEEEVGKIEINVSIDDNGKYSFKATEGVHPIFLTGLLQYSISKVMHGNESNE